MTETGSALNLIIVDDDPRVGRGFARLLGTQSYPTSVTTVGDAAMAAATAVADAANLVVVTIGPSSDGRDLAAIQRLRAELTIPVVALSAHDGLREPALSQGASAFIHYGMAPEQVLSIIRKVVELDSADPLPTGR